MAHMSEKSGGDYFCPECECQVIVRKPSKKIDHFAHKSGSNCAMGGESFQHMKTKLSIFKDYTKMGFECRMEHKIGSRRTDIAICIRGKWIAVEVQLSPIKLDELIERTINHTKNNFYTIWVVQLADALDEIDNGDEYKVRKFQRDIHDEIHDGALFQYVGNGEFSMVHLMGYRYETMKKHYVSFRNYRLDEMWGYTTDDYKIASVRSVEKWWNKKQYNSENEGTKECQH
jgi:competence CoiA-like predicted nuclease